MNGNYGPPSSWRLHRAHPALGLEELEGDRLSALWSHDLGAAWLVLEPAERERREADFVAALHAAMRPGAGWDVELVEQDGLLGVWMDRWKAPALQRELLDHVWEAARQRDVTAAQEALVARRESELARTLRAHARVGLSWMRYRAVRRPISSLAATVFVAAHVAGLFL